MELIEGRNLKEVLAERGRLAADEACAIASQAASALEAIHATGIVHRDVKTSNLMQESSGRVYVTDFGIATRGGPGTAGLAAGYVAGTPEYMSPEQAQGLTLDARSDVYALGVVLFELLSGRLPFQGGDTAETLLKQVQEPPPLAALDALDVPPSLRELLGRLLAKHPPDRPGSAGAAASQTVTLVPRRRLAARWAVPVAVLTIVAVAGWELVTRTHRFAALLPDSQETQPAPTTTRSEREAIPSAAHARQRASGRGPTATLGAPTPAPALPEAAEPASDDTTATTATQSQAELRHLDPNPANDRLADSRPSQPRPSEAAEAPAEPPKPAPPVVGHLQLGVAPWADVIVDGVPLGTTPMEPVPLPAGTHTARLIHPDFQPLVRKVTIRPGETTPLRIDLRLDGIRNR
jgi:serine/threonine protein kinase